MLNSRTLNTGVIGSGGTPAWILYAGVASLEAGGGLAPDIEKMFSASGAMVADGDFAATHYMAIAVECDIAADSDYAGRVLRPLLFGGLGYIDAGGSFAPNTRFFFEGIGYIEAGGSFDPDIIVPLFFGGTGSITAEGNWTPKLHLNYAATGSIVAGGNCSADDFYTGPAPLDRTFALSVETVRVFYMTRG